MDGFQKDWKNVSRLFNIIRPLLGQAIEDEDDSQSQVIARVIAHCCQMSDSAAETVLQEYV